MTTFRLPCACTAKADATDSAGKKHTRLSKFIQNSLSSALHPETRINLGNKHLLILRPELVHLFAQQCRCVNAMPAYLDFPARIARNQLARLNRLLQFLRIARDPMKPKRKRNYV